MRRRAMSSVSRDPLENVSTRSATPACLAMRTISQNSGFARGSPSIARRRSFRRGPSHSANSRTSFLYRPNSM